MDIEGSRGRLDNIPQNTVRYKESVFRVPQNSGVTVVHNDSYIFSEQIEKLVNLKIPISRGEQYLP